MLPLRALFIGIVGAGLVACLPTSAVADEPPRLKVDGGGFAVQGRCFVPYGYYYGQDATASYSTIRYLRRPTRWGLRRITLAFQDAKTVYGANTMRVFLELSDFMASERELNPVSVTGLRKLLDSADELGLYVVLTGNVTTKPHRADPWYESMGEQQRWRVQARFWRKLAAELRGDTTVAWYELTNEPAVPRDPQESWYVGEFGGYYWGQWIVRDLGDRDPDQVAREWMLKLREAVERSDGEALVSIGLLPWDIPANAFRPEVVAPILDLMVVHEYPSGDSFQEAHDTMVAWDDITTRPLVLGEVFALWASVETTEAFLVESTDHIAGYLSIYNGQTPDEVDPDDLKSVLFAANLDMFSRLKPQVTADRCGSMTTSPEATRSTTVVAKATARRSVVKVRIKPDLGVKKQWEFIVKTKNSGEWRALKRGGSKNVWKTKGAQHVKELDLPKGRYNVRSQRARGYEPDTSKVVRLVR